MFKFDLLLQFYPMALNVCNIRRVRQQSVTHLHKWL